PPHLKPHRVLSLSCVLFSLFSFLLLRPPPSPTLFPYTTLFRSYFSRSTSAISCVREATRNGSLPTSTMMRMEASTANLVEAADLDRKSTRLNSSHVKISYAVFCLKKKNNTQRARDRLKITDNYR